MRDRALTPISKNNPPIPMDENIAVMKIIMVNGFRDSKGSQLLTHPRKLGSIVLQSSVFFGSETFFLIEQHCSFISDQILKHLRQLHEATIHHAQGEQMSGSFHHCFL